MDHDADLEGLASQVVDCGFHIHKELGPGLLESAYELILAKVIADRRLVVQRQVTVPIKFLVEGRLIVELKSTERNAPVHAKQLLTYLRLMDLPLGLLMNFGLPTFKGGLQRVANNYFGHIGRH